MMERKRIAVMGSFVVDLMSRGPHLPVPGETVKGSLFKKGPGGKGSNQGVAAQRAGADVTMITKVGADDFGDLAINNFKSEGIDTSYVFRDKETETGTALIIVDENSSENMILVVLGACGRIEQEEISSADEAIRESSLILTQLETNMEPIEQVLDIAHKSSIPVILNPAPMRDFDKEILKKVTYITPNETEAQQLTGIEIQTIDDAREAANSLFEMGCKNVLITLGSKGVFVKNAAEEFLVDGLKVQAIDTTGAGDAFNGSFATAIAEGKTLLDATRFANAAAALSVTKLGTAISMANREEIEKFLKEK